jgi:hypothetical protein
VNGDRKGTFVIFFFWFGTLCAQPTIPVIHTIENNVANHKVCSFASLSNTFNGESVSTIIVETKLTRLIEYFGGLPSTDRPFIINNSIRNPSNAHFTCFSDAIGNLLPKLVRSQEL